MSSFAKTLLVVTLLVSVGALSACNTMSGAGEDLQAAGRGIEKSAEKNKGN